MFVISLFAITDQSPSEPIIKYLMLFLYYIILIYGCEITPILFAQDRPIMLVTNVPGYVLPLTQILSGPTNYPF